VVGPDGKPVMTAVNTTLLTDSNYQDAKYISVARDITELVERERLTLELQQAQKMESLGQLTGGIAHDFNNLLGIISGYSELALQKSIRLGEDKMTYHINHIQEAARRATNLVSQMLSFSRSDGINRKALELASFLQDDIDMIRATLPSTIEVITEMEMGLPRVYIDPTQLHQVLMNLSINARDAIRGVGTLTIKLRLVEGLDTSSPVSHKPVQGDWVELSVSDTGTGISENDYEKIFNPFYTTKEVGKGTGLGLSVIYKIMEDHQGHILIDSTPGQGTTFRLLFVPMDDADAQEVIEEEIESMNLPKGKGQHVLVVDDEQSLCDFLSQAIEMYGYQATCCVDSQEALEFFKNNADTIDMIVTDQTMPKMTGIELMSRIREIRPEMPVIICSGFSDDLDKDIAREMNITYLEKPVEITNLMQKISEQLSS
jgi:signal transduction histidine kinase